MEIIREIKEELNFKMTIVNPQIMI